MSPSNPIDYFAIKNTISGYCIALDTKNFSLLEEIFTQDVDGRYPFDRNLKGVQNVANAIQKR